MNQSSNSIVGLIKNFCFSSRFILRVVGLIFSLISYYGFQVVGFLVGWENIALAIFLRVKPSRNGEGGSLATIFNVSTRNSIIRKPL